MKRILITSLALGCVAALSAQHIDIKGKIVDNSHEVLEGATIAVYKQDSILINGTTSDVKGVFELKKLPADNYRIMISYVGYASENIQISGVQKKLDLGIISLASDTELKEVVITGSSKRYEIDRQVLIPTQNLTDISNNAWTLIKNMQLSRIQINPVTNEITTLPKPSMRKVLIKKEN